MLLQNENYKKGYDQAYKDLMKIYEGLKDPWQIDRVIFNPPATIVYWRDGAKTVVKCQENDTFDEEKGLALCFMKKALGNVGKYNNVLKKWCED